MWHLWVCCIFKLSSFTFLAECTQLSRFRLPGECCSLRLHKAVLCLHGRCCYGGRGLGHWDMAPFSQPYCLSHLFACPTFEHRFLTGDIQFLPHTPMLVSSTTKAINFSRWCLNAFVIHSFCSACSPGLSFAAMCQWRDGQSWLQKDLLWFRILFKMKKKRSNTSFFQMSLFCLVAYCICMNSLVCLWPVDDYHCQWNGMKLPVKVFHGSFRT